MENLQHSRKIHTYPVGISDIFFSSADARMSGASVSRMIDINMLISI